MHEKRTLTSTERFILWIGGVLITAVALGSYFYIATSYQASHINSPSRKQDESETNTTNSRNPEDQRLSDQDQSGKTRDQKKPVSIIPNQHATEKRFRTIEQPVRNMNIAVRPSVNRGKGHEIAPEGEKDPSDKSRKSSGAAKVDEDKEGQKQLTQTWHENIKKRKGTIHDGSYKPDENPLVKDAKIKIFKNQSTIVFPAFTVVRDALLEVYLCAEGGKSHESLFITKVAPKRLQFALTVTGFQHEENPSKDGPQRLGDPNPPGGDPVVTLVEWKLNNGKWIRYRAEDLVRNVVEKMIMRRVGFVFAGSEFIQKMGPTRGKKKIFSASRVKTLMSLFHDPSAILGIPVPQGGTDGAFHPRREVLPPSGTEVRFILKPPSKNELEEIEKNKNESKDAWGNREMHKKKNPDQPGNVREK